jgi:hypothetical protein
VIGGRGYRQRGHDRRGVCALAEGANMAKAIATAASSAVHTPKKRLILVIAATIPLPLCYVIFTAYPGSGQGASAIPSWDLPWLSRGGFAPKERGASKVHFSVLGVPMPVVSSKR